MKNLFRKPSLRTIARLPIALRTATRAAALLLCAVGAAFGQTDIATDGSLGVPAAALLPDANGVVTLGEAHGHRPGGGAGSLLFSRSN